MTASLMLVIYTIALPSSMILTLAAIEYRERRYMRRRVNEILARRCDSVTLTKHDKTARRFCNGA